MAERSLKYNDLQQKLKKVDILVLGNLLAPETMSSWFCGAKNEGSDFAVLSLHCSITLRDKDTVTNVILYFPENISKIPSATVTTPFENLIAGRYL